MAEEELGFRDRFSEDVETHFTMDVFDIWRNMIHLHDNLSQKRLFLMGLSTPDEFHRTVGNKSTLPESFLRKDDLFYEDVNNLVERCFGGCSLDTQQCMFPDDGNLSHFHKMKRAILTSLDDLSNNGLYNLAKLVTRGLVKFVKTRSQMKRVIRSSLLTLQNNQYPSDYQIIFQNEVSRLLRSPKNFPQNYTKHVKLTLKSHKDDVMKVLDRLKDMKFYTLAAINRKLVGTQRETLQLNLPGASMPKEVLIKRVTNLSLEMLHELGESDELPEPLVKAVAVAGLSLNLVSRSQDLSLLKFVRVTPEIKTLQDEIIKAIKLIDQSIRTKDMKKMRDLLDPNSKLDGRRIKPAVRNMLTEFLFDTVDMDAIPHSLLGVLSIINKRPMRNAHRSFSKDLMNGDVECILNASASLRQLMWECDPSNELDQDFVEAYMDEAEESDDGDLCDDSDDDQKLHANVKHESQNRFCDSSEEVGSTGYADDAHFLSPSSKCEATSKITDFASSKLADEDGSDTETSGCEMLISKTPKTSSSPLASPRLVDSCTTMSGHSFFKSATDLLKTDDDNYPEQSLSGCKRNRYVALQEVCDSTSTVAFQLIGHMLTEFGRVEALGLNLGEESYLRGGNSSPGNSQGIQRSPKRTKEDPNLMDEDAGNCIVIESVQRALPSFPMSQLETVKKFLSS